MSGRAVTIGKVQKVALRTQADAAQETHGGVLCSEVSTPCRTCTAPWPFAGAAGEDVGRRHTLRGGFLTSAQQTSPSSEPPATLL